MRVAIAGRDEIENFYRGAADGVFTMEAGTAEACAAVVQTLIDRLNGQRSALRGIDYLPFGEFDSAQQMGNGFAGKAEQHQQILLEFIASAQRLKESFEIAGALVADTEAANTAELREAEGGGR